MRDCFRAHLLFIGIVVFFASSCKKDTKTATILPDSMLTLEVEYAEGDNIDPFTKDTLNFTGFPGAVAYFENKEALPFLIIGKDMEKNDDIDCNYIASINLSLPGETRLIGLAFPVETKHRTLVAKSYSDLSTDKAALKLWLNDWFSNAYRDKGLKSIAWGNETDLYRKILTNRK